MTDKTYTNAELERLGDEVTKAERAVEYYTYRTLYATSRLEDMEGSLESASEELAYTRLVLKEAIKDSTDKA